MGPLRFILKTHQFWNGVAAGLVTAALAVVVALVARRKLVPAAGAAFAVAAYVALARSGAVAGFGHVPVALALGAALAFAAAELATRVRPEPWLVAGAALPGAIVTAGALVGVDPWVRIVVAGVGAIGGAAVADFDARRARYGLAPFLWLITVGAVYSTVPDTEAARALLGVAIPVACLGWPFLFARMGTGGAVASACLLGWVIGQGGAGRPGAVVGAVGTLGLFVLEPIVHRAARSVRALDMRRVLPSAAVTAVHTGCALAAARWAGLAHDASTALVRLVVVLGVGLACTVWATAVPHDPAEHR